MTEAPVDAARWTELLAQALDGLPRLFPDEALGYLAATAKAENPVRDAVAYFLHQRVGHNGYLVAREWPDPLASGRRDLAIVD